MFEPRFLGRVKIMGQTAGVPYSPPDVEAPEFTPASASGQPSFGFDQNIGYGYSPDYGLPPGSFMVAANPGEQYPANYPPDQYDCQLTPDGSTWVCIPLGLEAEMPQGWSLQGRSLPARSLFKF